MTRRAGTSEDDWEQFAKEILGELSWDGTAGKLSPRIGSDLAGFGWKSRARRQVPRAYLDAALSTTEYLRNPSTAGNQVEAGEERLADRYRRLSGQLVRAWAVAGGNSQLAELGPEIRFYEEVGIYMAKLDAEERHADGRPVSEDVGRLLSVVIAGGTQTGEVLDIYEAAGTPKPRLSALTPAHLEKAQQARNPHLAIEALRKLVLNQSSRVTRSNVIRERMFSERVAELIALAKEVSEEARRGETFYPPLDDDQLAFYDAVAENESAVREQGGDVLAQTVRDLVGIMCRDVRTDWTVRDDVRAKLRSSIKRLLVKYDYPPDQQPGAIKLVMEQMEQMAPGYADSNTTDNSDHQHLPRPTGVDGTAGARPGDGVVTSLPVR